MIPVTTRLTSLLATAALTSILAVASSAHAQPARPVPVGLGDPAALPSAGARDGRAAYLDEPSRILQIGEMEDGRCYPLLVVLPATGGTSDFMYSRLHGHLPVDAYYVMLTPGRPSRDDYLPRFYEYVTWADERVGADIAHAIANHAVDPAQVYVTGFSVGGDASWALLMRHPERYRGAVVLGARSSARARRGARALLREHRPRVAFAMGSSDQDVRRRGITRAHEAAVAAGLPTRLDWYPGAHTAPPRALIRALFAFVFAE